MIVGDWADFDALLPRAEVFVTNGGYGSVMQAIMAEAPLVSAGTLEAKSLVQESEPERDQGRGEVLGVEPTTRIRPEEDLVRIRALLPLSGIAFVALTVIGLAVAGSSPSPDAAADEVVSFYRDHENRARTGTWFFAFAMPFLPLFASSLAGLQRPEGQDSRVVWRRLLLVGAAIMSATLGVAITTQLALADSSTETQIAPEVMQALSVIAGYVVYALLPATGTMMLGAAGWLLGRERVQGWLGWAALVLGIGLFVPFIGVLALILSLVWIIVASITLFRARAAGPTLGALEPHP